MSDSNTQEVFLYGKIVLNFKPGHWSFLSMTRTASIDKAELTVKNDIGDVLSIFTFKRNSEVKLILADKLTRAIWNRDDVILHKNDWNSNNS